MMLSHKYACSYAYYRREKEHATPANAFCDLNASFWTLHIPPPQIFSHFVHFEQLVAALAGPLLWAEHVDTEFPTLT